MKGLEILELATDRPGDYIFARLAFCGRLAVPFEFPKSTYSALRTTADLERYLGQQARSLLDLYGDAREQRATPDLAVA